MIDSTFVSFAKDVCVSDALREDIDSYCIALLDQLIAYNSIRIIPLNYSVKSFYIYYTIYDKRVNVSYEHLLFL